MTSLNKATELYQEIVENFTKQQVESIQIQQRDKMVKALLDQFHKDMLKNNYHFTNASRLIEGLEGLYGCHGVLA